MMKRQPDGTWRNARSPIVVSPDILRSRWVEAEVLRMKTMGLSYDEMAEQVTRVGRGKSAPLVTIPQGVTFPDDYSIIPPSLSQGFQKGARAAARAGTGRTPEAGQRALGGDVLQPAARHPQGKCSNHRSWHQSPRPLGQDKWSRRASTTRTNGKGRKAADPSSIT